MNPLSEPIDIILPVHNEAGGIEATLREFYQVATERQIPVRFIVCEDGSTDNTVEVIQRLQSDLPIKLLSEPTRKGYSRAVIDGFRASQSQIVGFIDSDGQCDPRDLSSLYEAYVQSKADLILGYRNPRHDHWIRLLMSSLFKFVYRLYFSVPVKDPSCPYLLIKRESLLQILKGNVGTLKQGFWWEFVARAVANGLTIREVPVAHRQRASGITQVYKPTKVPGIAIAHLLGLGQLHKELKSLARKD